LINNRQSGRRRGRGGGNNGPRPQGGGGGGGRPDNGNRIDNRARGNAAQLLEKYRNLAADAQRQGDRVNTEYYLQFADHYFRVLSETRARQEEAQGHQNQQRRPQPADPYRDQFEDDEGDEFGEEGDAIRPGEQMMAAPDRGGERAPSADRGERQAGERAREDRPREDRPRDERGAAGQRDGYRAVRGDGARGESWRQEGAPVREDRQRRQPREEAAAPVAASAPPVAAPAPASAASEQPIEPVTAPVEAPRRRGRPPRRADAGAEPIQGMPAGVEGLPPAIGAATNGDDRPDQAAEEAPKPRRRRTPRAAEASAAE